MKIAMIGQKGIPTLYGGIERHVEDLSHQLADKGHDILVYARNWYTPKAITKVGHVRVIHTFTIHTKHLDAIIHTITSTISAIRQKPDVIHYHGVGPSLMAWIPRVFAPQIKIVVTTHCLDRYHQKWGVLARLALRLGEWTAIKFAHSTIVVSKNLKNYYLNEYQINTNYIPNGTSQIKEYPGSSLIEDEFNLKKDKYVLLVSRLVRHKGVHYLLDAWQYARSQYPNLFKEFKLVIVGDSTYTDDYVKELKEDAKDDESILFTGWQNGKILEQLYANTTLLVHPSENEGLPITVLQAMSYGRSVLLSDIPEHRELITDKKFLFNNASLSSLSDQLIKLMQDKKIRDKAGRVNREFVNKNFNWDLIAKQTGQIYANRDKTTIIKDCLASA